MACKVMADKPHGIRCQSEFFGNSSLTTPDIMVTDARWHGPGHGERLMTYLRYQVKLPAGLS